MTKYAAPILPDDLLPDLDVRIAEVRARYDNARAQGYAFYVKARAQQAAAEDALQRGQQKDHAGLMNGLADSKGNQVVIGVTQLDANALMQWAEARRYKAELDALQIQKAVEQAAKGDAPSEPA